ncbi:biotin carboxyl carrier protein [Propylenella binzhouense]|uniref:Biotin carboxyl carrier protein n=1 Tax=Propylenella binzhouense TaxID=2555902 RepID=A0A964T658_9HYPH|nr:biotin carboxyl carrier protein [Propylenella binzhouense]MYZ49134.1 biotin carboxyl carrier protein [Propylenella binzhouense]
MDDVKFVDTTVRDGQQSLWATGMRTGEMLPALPYLDRAGFEAIEIHANSFEKKMVRELLEDPFERLRLARQTVPATPLRIIRGRYLSSFQIAPRAVEEMWYERIGAYGIQEVRTSDSSNNPAGWRDHVEMARKEGIRTVLNLIFSISPRHTDDYYARKAREAAALRPYRICLKDPGALLTPDRLQTLVPAILANVGGITVEFHTHCNTGLGGLCTLEAIRLGIRTVNTAVPPLAEGSSNPSTFAVARNARVLGYRTDLDESVLPPVEAHFLAVAAREKRPVGVPLPYDAAHYIHQVPGGMISNLRFQLQMAGIGDRLGDVLDEIGRVRADFGYPIMVTPYSQFMGAQAVMNVLSGERYKTVSDEIVQYALGYWGEDEAESIDPDIRDRVLARPRAAELAKAPPVQATRAELRRIYGGPGLSEEDLLLRFFTDADQVATMRAAQRTGRGMPRAAGGIEGLLEALAGRGIRYLALEKGDASVRLQIGGEPPARRAETRAAPAQGPAKSLSDVLDDDEIEKIARLVQALDGSSLDFLTLEVGAVSLTLGKGERC